MLPPIQQKQQQQDELIEQIPNSKYITSYQLSYNPDVFNQKMAANKKQHQQKPEQQIVVQPIDTELLLITENILKLQVEQQKKSLELMQEDLLRMRERPPDLEINYDKLRRRQFVLPDVPVPREVLRDDSSEEDEEMKQLKRSIGQLERFRNQSKRYQLLEDQHSKIYSELSRNLMESNKTLEKNVLKQTELMKNFDRYYVSNRIETENMRNKLHQLDTQLLSLKKQQKGIPNEYMNHNTKRLSSSYITAQNSIDGRFRLPALQNDFSTKSQIIYPSQYYNYQSDKTVIDEFDNKNQQFTKQKNLSSMNFEPETELDKNKENFY